MGKRTAPQTPPSERGARAAIVFALVAERLTAFYDHNHWLTKAQGATLCADWLARSNRTMPIDQRQHLSGLSDQLARKIANSLTRDAGLYIAHEMMESLSQNNLSEVGRSLMDECVMLIDGEGE